MALLLNGASVLAFLNLVTYLAASIAVPGVEQPHGCANRMAMKRYVVIQNNPKTFFQAWRFCASIGLRLATVTSAEDTRLLEQTMNVTTGWSAGNTWWIGGTDLGREGSFIWIATNLPVGYKTGYLNFSPGQPDNHRGIEHCLEIGRFGPTLWNDMPCDAKLRFVCEDFDLSAS